MEAEVFTAIGLMSGTSMDGIDVAIIRSDGGKLLEHGESLFVAYDDEMRRSIELAMEQATSIVDRTQRPANLSTVENEITLQHINAVNNFLKKNNLKPDTVDLIGFHGQTVLHRPGNALSVQLGNGKMLAQKTGIDVICDMRANDLVNGGQGAPLVPAYHRVLVQNLPTGLVNKGPVVFVNIGGISNLTFIDPDQDENSGLIAFDCGPGNALIDQWVKSRLGLEYDENGAIAAKGNLNPAVVEHYLSHEYFARPVPKSLDRSDFLPLENDQISTNDGARTLAYITAKTIMNSVEHLPLNPATWIVCGGGALNLVIMRDLRELAANHHAQVFSANEVGLDAMNIEAEAFAYLAIRSKLNLDITWPNTTGCREPSAGGVLFPH